ncbi:unnamed protein product [Effrenium voratum]|nr:unnamed protein product [Effrenium voratum]
MQERLDSLRAYLNGVDFSYSDPWRNFDRSTVKGCVAKLFHIKPDFANFHRALEVCAGGRLFNVIVDNEETGKALLEKGQLRKRVTIIPLNKIQDNSISPQVVRQAKNIVPKGAEAHVAMEIIGCEKQVMNAMKYVFGPFIVCDTSETAKHITFHPNVRVKTVTKEGDLYDPSGTITGGSAPKGGNLLLKLQELLGSQLEKQVHKQRVEFDKAFVSGVARFGRAAAQLMKMQGAAQEFSALERELKCREHEMTLLQERISRSEHHTTEQSIQDMRAEMQKFQEDISNLPEEKKKLEKSTKQMEKDIKSLDSSREDRIKYFEGHIRELQKSAKQNVEKIEKQREKTEQAQVEVEVLRNELSAMEGKDQDLRPPVTLASGWGLWEGIVCNLHQWLLRLFDNDRAWQDSGRGQESLAAEMQQMSESLAEKKDEAFEEADRVAWAARLLQLRSLDESLGQLAEEVGRNKQKREEKDLGVDEAELEQKRVTHKIQQLQKDDKESHIVVARMEKEHPWIQKEQALFGKKGTDFDFQGGRYQDSKARLEQLTSEQKKLGKNINKKAMVMFERAEKEYQELLSRRDIILNDKGKIEKVIKDDLDEKKTETLRRTWKKVNKDFDSIFSTLLPNTNAKLEPPQGMDETEGLEIKVAFHGAWKQSLTELSGGQRSLLALSLVLALLLFKPAPMYILDEIDSALDLSHTQNIGHMIRTHFPHSQFIVVSLKEGMFNHANVLFRTRFIDGTSTVTRYAIRDEDDRVAMPPQKKARKDVQAK